jgi:hypothetical protein
VEFTFLLGKMDTSAFRKNTINPPQMDYRKYNEPKDYKPKWPPGQKVIVANA